MIPIILVLLAIPIVYILLRQQWKRPGRPAHFGYPLLGSAFTEFTTTKYFDTVVKYAHKLGPIYDIFIATFRFTVLSDIEDIKEVLTKRPKLFTRPQAVNKRFAILNMRHGIFVSEGNNWNRQRRIVAPPFSKKNVSNFLDGIWSACIHTINNEIMTKQGKVIDSITLLSSFTVHVIGLIAFDLTDKNTSTSSSTTSSSYFLHDQFKKDLKALFTYASERIMYGLPDIIWRCSSKYKYELAAQSASATMKAMALQLVQEERSKSTLATTTSDGINPNNSGSGHPQSNSFIQALIRAEEDSKFSDDEIVSNIITMFIAGTETTAVGKWCAYINIYLLLC